MMCHHDSSKVPEKWDAGRCNAGTRDYSLCLQCKVIYSDWEVFAVLQSKKEKKKKGKQECALMKLKRRTNLAPG